ncbi:hypothetical protein ACH41H_42315 [Streptomyces sp. NPDC020800]|uniref:hypothetical protein n=1 Tax=Streptomyces sp. NPDC020800 TaxID=3365092 RepID=UPI0037898944
MRGDAPGRAEDRAWGERMNKDTDDSRFHPARWGTGSAGAWPPAGLSGEERAWLLWLGEALSRGGFTSLGQACKEVTRPDESGRDVSHEQLHVVQSTLSRWLSGKTVPRTKKVLDAVSRLNECIEERRHDSPGAPGRITESELAEGLRMLNAARKAKDSRFQPAQYAHEEKERELAEARGELERMRALKVRLTGQLEEALASAARLQQRVQKTQAAADALQDDYDEAVRRVQHLEEKLSDVEEALEKWQDRYDRLHAESEMAREAAREERLAMQDELLDMRTTVWSTQQDLQAAQAARATASEDADRLREELRAAQQRGSQGDEERLRRINETAQQLMELTDSERSEVLSTIRNTWGGDDIYLLALRLGEEPGKGPKRARELTRAVRVHYYDPSAGKPSFYRRFEAEFSHTRLDPRPQLPRTRKQPSALPDDSDSTSDVNPFALGDGTQI